MSAPAPASVTVIIVAFNAGTFLKPCLDALAAQSFPGFEAVIVDNASTDGSVTEDILPDARFSIDRPGSNLGFAAANNRIAQRSGARWIALLNPDTCAAPDWLEKLLEGAQRWPDAAAFGSTQLRLDEPDVLDGAGDVWHAAGIAWRALEACPASDNPPEGETFAPCAAAALYDRATFLHLGGFDESFFCYCEDVDYGFRLRLAGGRCVQLADAIVYHAGSGTTGRHSDFTLFHGHRNRVHVFVKNTPGIWFWLLLPGHVALNLRILQKAPSDAYAVTLKRAYRAAWDNRKAILASRRATQKARKAPVRDILRAMAWTPKLITRRAALVDKSGRRIIGSRRAGFVYPASTGHQHD
ncbi:MAG: glycosyltransferase family 2 protein [Caulobacterales bacterium]|uniref:glycosyltransferase family 2 protein n=1 Tax=Glycocaulis sp. TaxID=1969725 RepID=UPI003F9F53F1